MVQQQSGPGTHAAAEEPYIVVSTDSHVGPSLKNQLRQYCEPKYLDEFDEFVAEMEQHGMFSLPASIQELDHGATTGTDLAGSSPRPRGVHLRTATSAAPDEQMWSSACSEP